MVCGFDRWRGLWCLLVGIIFWCCFGYVRYIYLCTIYLFGLAGVPVLLLAEIPFMMAKFAVFDAFSKIAYGVFPQAAESVGASLAVSLISGMVGEFYP